MARSVILHGALSGLLAGGVIAVWFLVLDTTAGEPLRTPATLAGAVLAEQAVRGGPRLIVAYTFLHFATFAALGVVSAWLVRALRVTPGLAVGLVVGLGTLNGVHYGALLIADAALVGLLPGQHVLAANLLGGLALSWYLHRRLTPSAPVGPAVLRQHPLVLRGIVAGAIGAAAVAIWFLVIDMLAGRPFFTPAALGSGLLLGIDDPAAIQVTVGVVSAYTLLHLLAFAAVGIVLVWVAERLEEVPGMWLMAFMGFVILEGSFILGLIGFSSQVLGGLSWWAVGVGNLLAVASMAAWIRRTHPLLRQRFATVPADTRV
jgi:hypothetical protein